MSLVLGDDWDRKLPQAQRDSRVTVVLISSKTDRAHYEREEIAHAIAMARKDETGHRVVPVYIDTDDQDPEVPYGLRVKHGLTLSRDGGLDGVAKRLLHLVKTLKQVEADRGATLSENDLDALFILQQVRGGLPSSVLYEAAKIEERDIKRLAAYIVSASEIPGGHLTLSGEYKVEGKRPNEALLLTRTLEGLIGYIHKHRKLAAVEGFLDAAFSLVDKCKDHDPRAARGLFDATDGILKRLGDKKRVAQAAEISIAASRHPNRDDDDVKIEARALICGRSWVLQRIGEHEKALVEATKSMELGDKIEWRRNTAFCNKCLGRLHRMMGERETDAKKKRQELSKSLKHLKDAIRNFEDLEGFGVGCAEIGDCYSLLARTLLASGQGDDVEIRQHLDNARERLNDESEKDYLDYEILEGDYAASLGMFDTAESHYGKVIESAHIDGCEKSEILARALHQRGIAGKAQGKRTAAIADFRRAAEMWEGLNERNRSAAAEWEAILLEERVPPFMKSALEKQCATVRVIALTAHEGKMAGLSPNNPRRSKPERFYVTQLIREAAKQDAKEDIGW